MIKITLYIIFAGNFFPMNRTPHHILFITCKFATFGDTIKRRCWVAWINIVDIYACIINLGAIIYINDIKQTVVLSYYYFFFILSIIRPNIQKFFTGNIGSISSKKYSTFSYTFLIKPSICIRPFCRTKFICNYKPTIK